LIGALVALQNKIQLPSLRYLGRGQPRWVDLGFINNRQSASPYYQLLEILKFENIVKSKTAILTHKLFVNPLSVPSLFHNFLMPVKSMQQYATSIGQK
jgi:hypothetical protein